MFAPCERVCLPVGQLWALALCGTFASLLLPSLVLPAVRASSDVIIQGSCQLSLAMCVGAIATARCDFCEVTVTFIPQKQRVGQHSF